MRQILVYNPLIIGVVFFFVTTTQLSGSVALAKNEPAAVSFDKVARIMKGVPAPFDGFLLPFNAAAKLDAKIHLCAQNLAEYKRWCAEQKKAIQTTERDVCAAKIGFYKNFTADFIKRTNKTTSFPWWTVVVFGVGMLGIGIGIGVWVRR